MREAEFWNNMCPRNLGDAVISSVYDKKKGAAKPPRVRCANPKCGAWLSQYRAKDDTLCLPCQNGGNVESSVPEWRLR